MAAQIGELTDVVRSVLRNPEVELHASTRFDDLPAWDSMYLVSVIVEIEFRWGLLFEPDEMDALHTAGDLLRMIAGKQALART